MQHPATFQTVKPQFPELEHLKCPRCESTNTKFCYYNNYNLSQPRHFCKNCRRYWTKGGALRNIPVGGGTRKNSSKKRPKPDPDSAQSNPNMKTHEPSQQAQVARTSTEAAPSLQEAVSCPDPRGMFGMAVDPDHKMLDVTGSFSSLLAANGGFGNVLGGLHPNGSDFSLRQAGGGNRNTRPEDRNNNYDGRERYMQSSGGGGDDGGGVGWSGGNSSGWPNLAIYTPGSNFQ